LIFILQQIINGLAIGSVYGLVALGFVLIYKATEVVNFAQGELMMLGAASTLFVSLGSIAGVVGTYAILVPLTIFSGFPIEYLIYASLGGAMIIYTHRGNIKRLLAGKERKLGQKAEHVHTEANKAP